MRRSERDESVNFGGLIVRTKIDMQTVLALLGFINSQEQDPWKTIWPWLNLKDRRVVVDDDPPERFAPPPTQRTRVRRGDNDLLPLKAHGTTIDPRSRAAWPSRRASPSGTECGARSNTYSDQVKA